MRNHASCDVNKECCHLYTQTLVHEFHIYNMFSRPRNAFLLQQLEIIWSIVWLTSQLFAFILSSYMSIVNYLCVKYISQYSLQETYAYSYGEIHFNHLTLFYEQMYKSAVRGGTSQP